MLHFTTPPKHICILRLSAIGDISHTLPVIRSIQSQWPQTRLTWIIGKTEFALLDEITDIEFIVFDKQNGFKEYLKIYRHLKHIKFDVLLHMQMSLRASLISLIIRANIKLGFDRQRAKDAQWLFTNKKIKHHSNQHVMDSLFGFSEALGLKKQKPSWNIPISEKDRTNASKLTGHNTNYILISPCSSKAYRNWNVKGYAAIADYINDRYSCDVILTGGNSKIEIEMGNRIIQTSRTRPLNLIGTTNLKELLSLIENAICVISPDSGPAHLSTAMGTPVIGLYAATNPERARPYLSSNWAINRYPDAIFRKFNKNIINVPWGTRVRDNWVMDLILVNDVKNMIDKFMSQLTNSK